MKFISIFDSYCVLHLAELIHYGRPNVAIFNSFNFISSFVFCIQLCVQYSTCIQHSTHYSIFNFPIQHSTIHFIFNSSFTHSIIYSTVSTIYSTFNFNFLSIQLFIQHSTIHSTFNFSFNIQLFIQHSTFHSTFNYSFNIQLFVSIQLITRGEGPGNEFIFPEPSLFLVSNCIRVTISFPRFTIDRFIRLRWRKI